MEHPSTLSPFLVVCNNPDLLLQLVRLQSKMSPNQLIAVKNIKLPGFIFVSCAILFSFNVYAQLPPIEIRFSPSETVPVKSVQDSAIEASGNNAVLEWNALDSSFSRRNVRLSVDDNDINLSLFSGLQDGSSHFLLAQSTDTDEGVSSGVSAPEAGSEEQAEMAQLAEAMANPLSYLWLIFTQTDTVSYDGDILDTLGEDDLVNNTLLLQPVLSIQLTKEWKTVFRPVIPINSYKTVGNVDLTTGSVEQPFGVDLERETGLGDIVLWAAFSNQYKPPNIFGFGVTTMLDTATDDQLGTGKNSIGPMALAFRITPKWILGVIGQHWESVSGSDSYTVDTDVGKVKVDRADVSLTDIQPVIRYRLSPLTNIGMAPNWRYNHETDEASIPLGIGFDTLVKMGKVPVKVGAEFYHYVQSDDDFGPDWAVRLLFVPVLPSPEWSRQPLF